MSHVVYGVPDLKVLYTIGWLSSKSKLSCEMWMDGMMIDYVWFGLWEETWSIVTLIKSKTITIGLVSLLSCGHCEWFTCVDNELGKPKDFVREANVVRSEQIGGDVCKWSYRQ